MLVTTALAQRAPCARAPRAPRPHDPGRLSPWGASMPRSATSPASKEQPLLGAVVASPAASLPGLATSAARSFSAVGGRAERPNLTSARGHPHAGARRPCCQLLDLKVAWRQDRIKDRLTPHIDFTTPSLPEVKMCLRSSSLTPTLWPLKRGCASTRVRIKQPESRLFGARRNRNL